MELQEEYLQINSGCTPESPDQSESESSQNDSSSDKILSYLLERSLTRLHHKKESRNNLWVFWSKNEGSENNSSSAADLHDKIKFAFEAIYFYPEEFLVQLWAPVTISSGRRLLSTSGQPFAISYLFKELVDYRLYSEKIEYNIDVNNLDIEDDHNIKSGGPATAFLNRLPYISDPLESESYSGLKYTLTLPICFHPQSDCIAVLEITSEHNISAFVLSFVQYAVKEVGLHVCNVQEHISYKTINGLAPTKVEIKQALEIVCMSHQISLAQVWIPFEDKSHVPLSSNSEDTPSSILGLKWTDYLHADFIDDYDDTCIIELYDDLCDDFTFKLREEHALKTLEDFKPRYISKLCDYFLIDWEDLRGDYCAFAICLRSLHTGDFSFAFKFIWRNCSRCDILLEAILLTIKRCLPSFKLASGEELGDKLDVIEVGGSEDGQNKNFKIFQGKRPSPTPMGLEKGKQPVVVENTAPSALLPLEDMGKQSDVIHVTRGEDSNSNILRRERLSPSLKASREGKKPMVKRDTRKKPLRPEDIMKQFGKTMDEAAEILKVSKSTLKRNLNDFGIQWEGQQSVKRNKKDLSIKKLANIHEVDNGAIQNQSTFNMNENTVTIKAEYGDDIIKIRLPVLQAKFLTVQEKIGTKFNLRLGTYKIKYRDESEEWILLTSDEDMIDCIESFRKLAPCEVRMRVLPSTQPISGPSCS